jgi:hypothetical protein
MVPIGSAAKTGRAMTAAMVVITDITENRKLQWQAIRSARLASLGVLSAGIAHEISNPNHAIMANAPCWPASGRMPCPSLPNTNRSKGISCSLA